MRFNFLSVALLVGSAYTLPVHLATRDTSVIDHAIKRITSAQTRLDNGFKSRPPGGDNREAERITNNLLSLSYDLINEIGSAANAIRRAPPVSMVESYSLIQGAETTNKLTLRISNGWIDSRPMVMAGGKMVAVYDSLVQSAQATSALFDAIISKLNPYHIASAQNHKANVIRTIERAIYAYKW